MRSKNQVVLFALLTVVVLEYFLLCLMFGQEIVTKVFADSFYPLGKTEESKLFLSYALGFELTEKLTEKISGQETGEGEPTESKIITSNEFIKGRTRNELSDVSFHSLVTKEDSYKRVVSEDESVVIPPNAGLYLKVLLYNETGHIVTINNAWLFLEQYGKGSIGELLNVKDEIYRNIAVNIHDMLRTKGGSSISLGAMGNIYPGVDAGPREYAKEFYIGQMKNSVNVSEYSAKCVGEDLEVETRIRNTGQQVERIKMVGNELSVDPLSSINRKTIIHESKGDSFELVVEKSTPICLANGGVSESNILDAHALILSRNDENHSLWNSAVLDVPITTSSEAFCVSRSQYSLVFDVPVCVQQIIPPLYSLNVEGSNLTLPASASVVIPFLIQNQGGDDAGEHLFQVVFPQIWKSSVIVELISPENQVVQYESDALTNGVLLKGIKHGESIQGSIKIKTQAIFNREEGERFSINLRYGDLSKSVDLEPEIKGVFTPTELSRVCSTEGLEFKLKGEVASTGYLDNITFTARVSGLPSIDARQFIFSLEDEIMYEVTLESTDVDIILNGSFAPGEYAIDVKGKSPMEDVKEATLTAGEKTANIAVGCPLVIVKPQVSPTSTQNIYKHSKPKQLTVGLKPTLGSAKLKPSLGKLAFSPAILGKTDRVVDSWQINYCIFLLAVWLVFIIVFTVVWFFPRNKKRR